MDSARKHAAAAASETGKAAKFAASDAKGKVSGAVDDARGKSTGIKVSLYATLPAMVAQLFKQAVPWHFRLNHAASQSLNKQWFAQSMQESPHIY